MLKFKNFNIALIIIIFVLYFIPNEIILIIFSYYQIILNLSTFKILLS